jgi:pyrimidine-nucleoside phosphorylase
MLPQWVIEKKRDGHALTEKEIRFFIEGYTRGTIPDYQMAALAMAVFFRGMDAGEVTVLTETMLHSGDVLDTSSIRRPKADKHSTGGIGDKVSLVLAPLAACCGVAVPMISGRGLGITGGTLDKLEAIPGYRTDLDTGAFLDVLDRCGCAVAGQTATLVPADRKLYALRDVTGTVPSIPLISASIMSKKLAEGTDALVLDVKWGKGAFMKTLDAAPELARTMVSIGGRMDKAVTALLTDMNQPLGRSAGNAVEVAEAVETLRGDGPPDLVELTLELGAEMLRLTGQASDRAEARARLSRQIESGAALDRFKTMVRLQGGAEEAIEDLSRLPAADLREDLPSPGKGYVAGVNAESIGRACLVLGAGRQRVEDTVDPAVGVTGIAKAGERVEPGQPLLTLHANHADRLEEARRLAAEAFTLAPDPPEPAAMIAETIPGGDEPS